MMTVHIYNEILLFSAPKFGSKNISVNLGYKAQLRWYCIIIVRVKNLIQFVVEIKSNFRFSFNNLSKKGFLLIGFIHNFWKIIEDGCNVVI